MHPVARFYDADPFEVKVLHAMRLRDEMARPVLLAKHSSISSNVSGGPYSNNELRVFKAISGNCPGQSCLRAAFGKAAPCAAIGGADLLFQCGEHGRKELTCFAAHERTRKLPRPLVMSVRGQLDCEPVYRADLRIVTAYRVEGEPTLQLDSDYLVRL